MSKLLMNRDISLKQRLRVFDSTVGSCVLWCTESWTPRADEFRQLESARRSMLRKIVGLKRRPDEEWLDWLHRSTHKALSISSQVGIRSWGDSHLTRKWHWAGHVARRINDMWLLRVTCWRESHWQSVVGDFAGRLMRPSRRRWMKWEDGLRRYCDAKGGLRWMLAAADKEAWNQDAEIFAVWCQTA